MCQQGIILLQTPSRQGHHSRSLRLFIIICCCFVAIVLKRGKIFTFNFILNMICLVTKKVRWSIRFRCKAPITTFSTIGQRIFFFFFFQGRGEANSPPPPPSSFDSPTHQDWRIVRTLSSRWSLGVSLIFTCGKSTAGSIRKRKMFYQFMLLPIQTRLHVDITTVMLPIKPSRFHRTTLAQVHPRLRADYKACFTPHADNGARENANGTRLLPLMLMSQGKIRPQLLRKPHTFRVPNWGHLNRQERKRQNISWLWEKPSSHDHGTVKQPVNIVVSARTEEAKMGSERYVFWGIPLDHVLSIFFLRASRGRENGREQSPWRRRSYHTRRVSSPDIFRVRSCLSMRKIRDYPPKV